MLDPLYSNLFFSFAQGLSIFRNKKPRLLFSKQGFCGANYQDRTGDLSLTMAALYLLS